MSKPKQIWLVNLFFGTGVAPTGVLLESVALGLRKAGHLVEVVTGRSRYNAASGRTERRYDGQVHQIYCGAMDAKGFGGRLLSWLIFYLGVLCFAFSRRLPNTVIIMTTPPYLHLIFAVRNWFARKKALLILWNQDTYPEILAAVGMASKRSLPYRLLMWLQRFGTSRVNEVIALDQAMNSLMVSHGGERVHIVPNWELEPPQPPLAKGGSMRDSTMAEFDDELAQIVATARLNYRFVVLYTGNYGWGHDLSILFDWIKSHPGQRDYFFLFVGGGEKWETLRQFQAAHRPPCMAVHSYVSKARVLSLIADADFGLVALERDCVGLMSPSKIHGYLALGKPLIYLGPAGSNVADAVANYQCGFQIEETDTAGLHHCLGALTLPEFDYGSMSDRATKAAQTRYVESVGVRGITAIIEGP